MTMIVIVMTKCDPRILLNAYVSYVFNSHNNLKKGKEIQYRVIVTKIFCCAYLWNFFQLIIDSGQRRWQESWLQRKSGLQEERTQGEQREGRRAGGEGPRRSQPAPSRGESRARTWSPRHSETAPAGVARLGLPPTWRAGFNARRRLRSACPLLCPTRIAVGVLSARPAPRPASGKPRPAPPPPAPSAAQLGRSWGPERPPPTAGRRRAPRRCLRSGPLSAALRSRDGKSGSRRRLPRPGSALLAGAGLWVLGAQGSCGGGAGGVPRYLGPARETPSPEAARPGCGHSLPSRRVAGFARGAGVELPRKPRGTLLSGTLELFC
ncbi:translation initiation factor IF-2-like [Prionailurus bengalensis]|uniref:translation initiation factor IF-2-like n=1 Tax=Prionailurus bengalensis TaxID=37029 RepID=UPI001CA8C34E|nr:translation initiation factor IF-2-like [Prionailurus bengalensis]